jgi:hypothetical protein
MATVTATNFRSTIGSANKQSLLRFHHTFSEKLHLQGVASLGLGYVDSNIQNGSSAVPQIFHETYRSRAYQERDKYNITDPNATNVNNFGFLSPAWIGLGERGRVMTPSLSLSNNSVLGLMNDSLNMRIENSGPSHETIQVQQLNTLRSVGIGVTALKVPLKKEVVAPDVVAPETPDASEYLSANSAFYLANRERFSEIRGSQRTIIRSRRDVLATSPLVAKVVNQAMVDFTPAPVMINADLLPGSIAAIKNTQDTTLVPTSPATTAVVNFGSIAKVQYLAPYSAELGVESQIWRTLDSVTFESAVEDSRPLICRLIKVTTVTSINEGLKLEPLAKYFVLGPITVRSTTQLPLPNLGATDEGRSYVDELEEIGDEILYSCNPVFNLPTGGN